MTDYLIKEDVFMALTGDITDCTIEEFIARLRDKLSKLPNVNVATNEDCISRAKAIEEADKLCLETAYDNEKVIEMLNDLPSVAKDINATATDCISRQVALDMLEDINAETEGVGFYYEHYVEYIKNLPSVTPKEKTGKWESTEIFYGGESKGAIIKCSECGNELKVSPKVFENLYDNERFCNYCGARMVSE